MVLATLRREEFSGRAFHSSTSQINLIRFYHRNRQTCPPKSAHVKPIVDECKPLFSGVLPMSWLRADLHYLLATRATHSAEAEARLLHSCVT